MASHRITNIVMVLKAFFALAQTKITNLKYVYDPDLSFRTAVERKKAQFKKEGASTIIYPLIAFRRGVLRPTEELQRRGQMHKAITMKDSAGFVDIYNSARASMDVNLIYIVNNLNDLENFEVDFNSENGLRSINTFTVDLSSAGSGIWTYNLRWETLEDKNFNLEDNFYNTISLTAVISGVFLTLDTLNQAAINQMVLDTKTFSNEVLYNQAIIL